MVEWAIHIVRLDGTEQVIFCDNEEEARARYAEVIAEQEFGWWH